ncbi:stage II sporulation protein E [Clostridium zeae]|uniref:Stage II sporulation protein E n=1 Tax=Clostridium zeae TaxID=2759022 RepID=A0ABQ1EH97_9CLOT|nr:stage II sporulation protein E [Clostridium zeae]GFZ34186.1 stage II sporulation protein E [Clostridium zeae]
MQYGVDVTTYKRISDRKKDKKELKLIGSPYRLLFNFIGAFLISRVTINANGVGIEGLSPFGIAFILSFLNKESKKEGIVAAVGVLLGYATLLGSAPNIGIYILSAAIISIFTNIRFKLKEKVSLIMSFSILMLSMIFYRAFSSNISLWINIVTSLVQCVVVYPIYYIIKYALTCLDDIKTNHFFTSEELIAMALLFCLIISGIGSIALFGISIRNVVALFFVIIIAFSLGSSVGAAAGVAMGIIVGLSTNNMMLYISVYSICGLMVGIFKDTGKWFTMLAYIVVYFVLSMYSKKFDDFKVIEALIVAVLFSIVPLKFYNKLSLELDNERKQDTLGDLHFCKIKEEFTNRLVDFTDILSTISVTLNNLVDNDRLLLKNKSSALIENLADRVCSSCDMRYTCWKRELHSTYNSFSELIRSNQEGKSSFPLELDKKCIKKYALVKNTEEIVGNYVQDEMLKRRLGEGRKLLAGHINNMAITIGELIDDFSKDIVICNDVERTIKRALNKESIKYDDILCYNDKNGRLKIKVTMDSCGGGQVCIKDVLPVINKSIGKTMSIGGDGCSIDPNTNKCSVYIEETPKYHVSSYAAIACKDGEKYTGDSYSYGKTQDGNYMVLVSDGMGSGPEAGAESKAAVELIEKFTQVGFSELTAINTVNSIMSMKFSEDEKFATLDLQNIDLYTGNAKFMKVGAVESFIKKGEKVELVKSKTLPFGILDTTDVDIVEKKVSNGDLIVTISDGILYGKDGDGSCQWLTEFLRTNNNKNPKELSLEILDKAKEISGAKIKDDMTVVVSKVFAIY